MKYKLIERELIEPLKQLKKTNFRSIKNFVPSRIKTGEQFMHFKKSILSKLKEMGVWKVNNKWVKPYTLHGTSNRGLYLITTKKITGDKYSDFLKSIHGNIEQVLSKDQANVHLSHTSLFVVKGDITYLTGALSYTEHSCSSDMELRYAKGKVYISSTDADKNYKEMYLERGQMVFVNYGEKYFKNPLSMGYFICKSCTGEDLCFSPSKKIFPEKTTPCNSVNTTNTTISKKKRVRDSCSVRNAPSQRKQKRRKKI